MATTAAAMAAIDLAPGAGLAAGRYRVERLLATGGMATVWLAQDERLGRPVAVKALADNLALDEAYVARFEREARLLARLSHPCLVQVFDYGTESHRPFLIMEYVEGPTLAEELAGNRRLEGAAAVALAGQLLSALAHIHDAGILHRDVKPANVLLDPTRKSKLTDFGIAQAAESTRMTQVGLVMGTPRYLAPELIAGVRPSARSDLYACGVLLDEASAPNRPARLRRLICALAAKEPLERPTSAANALATLVQSEPHATSPGSPRAEPAELRPSVARAPTLTRGSRPPRVRPWAPPSGATVEDRPAPQLASGRRTPAVGRRRWFMPALLAALIGAVVLVAAAASSGGSGKTLPGPAPAGAPLSRQLEALQRSLGAVNHR